MRGKQEEGGGTHQILQRPIGEATQPKLLSLLSCETAAAFKAALRRDWQQLQLSLSLSLSVRREPLDGKPRERNENLLPSSTSSILLSQRETHLPPALGEAMVVYVEWCAIMTVQQINVTQVCGKWWNFRVIPCKLFILSGGSCNTEACSTSLTLSNLTVVLLCQNVWQPALLYICVWVFKSWSEITAMSHAHRL